MLERDFQKNLVKELKGMFPDALVFKNEAKQGYPDILILNGDKWAALECKKCANASHRPNQDYYVAKMDQMSFSSFIYPENKTTVLLMLQGFLNGVIHEV